MAATSLSRTFAAGAVKPTATVAAVAEADADAQAVVDLVNRFVISSVQFINRFSDECESRLVHTAELLQQLELKTQLLEHLLISSGAADSGADEGEEESSARSNDSDDEVSCAEDGNGEDMLREGGSDTSEVHSYRERRGRRRRTVGGHGEEGHALGLQVPPPPSHNRRAGDRPPPPDGNRKGPPPRPPGATRAIAAAQEAEAARIATLAIVGAPVLIPPLPGDTPAPPPPLELRPGRLLTRSHPRLRGYFELLSMRVPVALVKAKMQADGFQGEWLDTPDAPAPSGLSTAVRAFVDEPD
ncbi:hypothetical protein LSCM1_06235 [Leishmania martiniquensis]|uniref:Uncharacterized protein n=1 Tax=Leishmania martiniquensis TaxID=1580590 RepID=A0A836KPC4_9TRYP|nr:hypothetical protein LSCM1_06235 [Leishmania martiniquensis]